MFPTVPGDRDYLRLLLAVTIYDNDPTIPDSPSASQRLVGWGLALAIQVYHFQVRLMGELHGATILSYIRGLNMDPQRKP